MTGILLVDDHKIFWQGLRILLEKYKELKVLGGAEDGLKAIEMAEELKPDVIIMDISMPGMNGIEAARTILMKNRHIKIIMLSMHSSREFVSESFKAGACAYILKETALDEIILALKKIIAGKRYIGTGITDIVLSEFTKNCGTTEENSAFSVLTSRERQVLQLLAEGYTTKVIASRLNISVKTVEVHRKQIKDRLNLSTNAELIKYAIREGVTTL